MKHNEFEEDPHLLKVFGFCTSLAMFLMVERFCIEICEQVRHPEKLQSTNESV